MRPVSVLFGCAVGPERTAQHSTSHSTVLSTNSTATAQQTAQTAQQHTVGPTTEAHCAVPGVRNLGQTGSRNPCLTSRLPTTGLVAS